jgi:monofunctional biosynthetic peptidoglycan transglycosylase
VTIPSRPLRLSQKVAATRRRARSGLVRLKRVLFTALLLFLLLPPALLVVYRYVPVPLTPLMVIRAVEGEALQKNWVPLQDMAPALAQAALAAEDNLFCQHRGFDLAALRGEIDAYLAGERARGASTITMQTAKNLFLWPGRSLARKALEAWLTPQIELLWPKRRILEVYLNVAEFGPGIYGAEAAARTHFGKPARELTEREAALLAAVLPNPREWSASRPGDYVSGRARTIQTRIQQLGPMLDCASPD